MRLLTNMLAIVYFYQVEETDEESINLPFIVINSLDPYSPRSFASNNYFNQNFVVQIDVESKEDSITKLVANEITKELFKHYLFKLDGGLDEFFIETQRFVDSRRYEGIPKILIRVLIMTETVKTSSTLIGFEKVYVGIYNNNGDLQEILEWKDDHGGTVNMKIAGLDADELRVRASNKFVWISKKGQEM